MVDVFRRVEQREIINARTPRFRVLNAAAQPGGRQFCVKCRVTIRTKRVILAKTIAGNRVAFVYVNGFPCHKFFSQAAQLFSNGAAYRIMHTSFATQRLLMAQYIYTMNRVAKMVPPKRFIIEDISLSFFPGAKIGVLGLNGSGKSTLLRIMAGIDKEFDGEARPQPGIKIGYLPQEPQLDPSK